MRVQRLIFPVASIFLLVFACVHATRADPPITARPSIHFSEPRDR